MTRRDDDVLEIGTAVDVLWRAKWRLAAWGIAGALVGGALLLVLPKQWEAKATVIASSSDATSSLLSKSGISEAIAGSLLGGGDTGFETELELLRSKRLLREITTLLPIAVDVAKPATTPASLAISSFVPRGQFAPLELTVRASNGAWQLQHESLDTTVASGAIVALPQGTLVMATTPAPAPPALEVELLDDEDTMRRLAKRVKVARVGGDIAGVTVRWDDSVTGAQLANAIVRQYVAWRQTDDQGDNAKLGDFLSSQSDSIDAEFAAALDALRRFQEANEYADPQTSSGILLGLLSRTREQLSQITLQETALTELLTRLTAPGTDRSRQLPSFPAFLNSPAINDLLSQLNKLETERAALLQTRTARDPSVAGRTEGIALIEAQLVPLARTYGAALAENRRALTTSADSVQRLLTAIPGTGRRYGDLLREVERLGAISSTLQAQSWQLRMATIGEGGGAEQLDEATPSRAPVSPNLLIVLALGIVGGTVIGVGRELLRAAPAPLA